MTSTAPASKIIEMAWGQLVMSLPTQAGEPSDIRINFRNNIAARRQAFDFARAMQEELAQRFAILDVDAKIEFVTASDHYHLLVGDRSVAQAKVAAGLMRTISHGAMSGRGTSGRSVTATITGQHRVAVED